MDGGLITQPVHLRLQRRERDPAQAKVSVEHGCSSAGKPSLACGVSGCVERWQHSTDVSLFAGEVAGGLTQVEEWLDAGEFEFAYADLVTIAEDSKPSPDV